MAIIGPRPITNQEVSHFFKHEKDATKFFSIRPGITGLWQVNSDNVNSYEERIKMELWYIEEKGLLLNLKIVFRTVAKIFELNGK